MNKILKEINNMNNFLLGCLLILGGFYTTNANAGSINDIDFTVLPGNRIQIALKMDSVPEKPSSFSIESPSRIAFDFKNTDSKLKKKTIPIGTGIAKSITIISVKNQTRVVLNLTTLTSYKTTIEGNNFYIILNTEKGDDNTEKSSAEDPEKEIAGSDMSRFGESELSKNKIVQKGLKTNRYLKNVDFRRGAQGEGRIILEFSSNNIPASIKNEKGKVIIDLLDTGLPTKLRRRLDVLDFATPIKSIDTHASGKNIKITVNTSTNDYEQLAYQTKNIFTVELKPLPKEEIQAKIKAKFGYTGEKLSLNFQDIEIRAVLQLLADFTGQNLVVSDTVTGKLTLRLKDVPWDHALDIILKTKALGLRENGNVLLIAPTEEIAAREKLELEALQQTEELSPLKTEFIQINYGKSANLAEMIRSKENTILSSRGSVTLDERTNTLIVRDTEEILTQIRTLVNRLDKPVRQVLIESRVVIASDTFGKELGVRWGVNSSNSTLDVNSESTIVAGNSSVAGNIASNNFGSPQTNRYAVNLPVASATSSIAFAVANLSKGTLLELELSALQEEGQGEVIASPRVITANQKEATIENGIEVPYIVSSGGDATVNFKKAVLSLKVTPQITPDDRVILDIKVNKDAVGEYITVGASSIPSIDKREIMTQVLVNNGETIVLGGVYEENTLKKQLRTPFFSDLPLIGDLFKSKSKSSSKSELLVFVTPKIIKNIAGISY